MRSPAYTGRVDGNPPGDEPMSDAALRAKLIRLAHTNPELREAILPLVSGMGRTAAWENLPEGWTDESVQSFWDSLTGDVKHKITKCMKQMEGKVTDTGAFCGSLASQVGYRAASTEPDAA